MTKIIHHCRICGEEIDSTLQYCTSHPNDIVDSFCYTENATEELCRAAKVALELLESLGYKGGDIHDDLAAAIRKIQDQK